MLKKTFALVVLVLVLMSGYTSCSSVIDVKDFATSVTAHALTALCVEPF